MSEAQCEICSKVIDEDKLVPVTVEDEPLVICQNCEPLVHKGHWRSR